MLLQMLYVLKGDNFKNRELIENIPNGIISPYYRN